jgi:hypothetical protein
MLSIQFAISPHNDGHDKHHQADRRARQGEEPVQKIQHRLFPSTKGVVVNLHACWLTIAVANGRQSVCRSRHHNDGAGWNTVSHQLIFHHSTVA